MALSIRLNDPDASLPSYHAIYPTHPFIPSTQPNKISQAKSIYIVRRTPYATPAVFNSFFKIPVFGGLLALFLFSLLLW